MPPDCPLCAITAGDALTLFANDAAIGLLSTERAVIGHAVVIAREHVEHFSSLDDPGSAGFAEVLRRVEAALLRELPADRVIAVKLGLVVPHLHVHLYPVPRSATRDDVVAIIERRVRCEMSDDELERLAARLRSG